MKSSTIFLILFVMFLMNSCSQKVESEIEKPKASTPEVYAIHEIDIHPDVDKDEFETFIMKELAPIYNKMSGQNFYLAKGDRGIRTNKYAIILTFESVEDRDRIYPPSGVLTEDFGADSIWEKFDAMTTVPIGTLFTDYIRVKY